MTYTLETIIRDARIALGLNPKAEPAWHADAACAQLTPDMKIKLMLEEAARDTCRKAEDAELAECALPLPTEAYFNTDHSGKISLPEDYMRLCVFRMDDWEQPVTNTIEPHSEAYRMQYSRYAGLRGNPQRPACAVMCDAAGVTLEFYGSKSRGAKVAQGLYYPYPSIKDGALTNMPQALYGKMLERLREII
ncbi:MAG: hypothetical protein NC102_09170 [Clostridium sp.]|nr:hypothetical protein [Clostridium sp.]